MDYLHRVKTIPLPVVLSLTLALLTSTLSEPAGAGPSLTLVESGTRVESGQPAATIVIPEDGFNNEQAVAQWLAERGIRT